MISLPNPTSKMTFDREQLIEDYIQQIIDGMDFKTMECFVYDTLKDNLMPYTDEELIEEVKEYNPELLEE
jgi:hypothetical protein